MKERQVRKDLQLWTLQDLVRSRLLGSEVSHEELREKMGELPSRGYIQARLDIIRKEKRIGKTMLEEALRLAQLATLMDVWEVQNARLAGSLLHDMANCWEEAEFFRPGKGERSDA